MNKENAIVNINKYGKIGKVITRIAMIIIFIGLLATLVGGITLIAVPEKAITFNIDNKATFVMDTSEIAEEISDSEKEQVLKAFNSGVPAGINLGAVRFSLDEGRFEGDKLIASSTGNISEISLKSLGYAVLAAAVALILTWISLLFGSRLCKAFEKCETPFEENVIKKMNHFALALLPWALYSSIPESVMNSVLNNSLKMSMSLDFNIIFTVLIILAFSTVFKYGAELQRESDETL